MPPRAAISNGIITVVILFFMALLGMLLKARYRIHSDSAQKPGATAVAVPKAIPVAIPVQEQVHEARAYKQGDWWVLPKPELVPSRTNEADTLRIKAGPKEDVFVLYFVDAAELSASRPGRLKEQSGVFLKASTQKLLTAGENAMTYVSNLLNRNPFKVYTRWGRVPETERYYAFITVEVEKGKHYDLGELLVRKGFAAPLGQQTTSMPQPLGKSNDYLAQLGKAMGMARAEGLGAWVQPPPPQPPPAAVPAAIPVQ